MKIQDFLENNQQNSPDMYYKFETLILQLLKEHLSKQSKPFYVMNRDMLGDAYAQEGFDDIVGGTIIEIKYHLSRRTYIRALEEVKKYYEKFSDVKNILLISADYKQELNLEYLNERFTLAFPNQNLIIWGIDEINRNLIKNSRIPDRIINNLFHLRLENALLRDDDWKKEREERVKEISMRYERGQFSLFLGAGVSSSAGIPDWNTLLNSMMVNIVTSTASSTSRGTDSVISDNDINEIVNRLNQVDTQSALMAARYIRKGLSNNGIIDFDKEVTRQLYKLRDKSKAIDSELIKNIGFMCAPRRTGAKVKNIINYNFDDLIERQLIKSHISFKSVFCESDSYSPEELPVYHVHGFLPENDSKYKNIEKSTFVFSEEGYHKIYSDPYHWSNLVQLNSLRDNTCLMIGLSMTDPNLRRLLDISARNSEEMKHYAFFKRIRLDDFIKENGKRVISSVNTSKTFLDNHFKLNEELMNELGVQVIWYENYDEIPEILKQIVSII